MKESLLHPSKPRGRSVSLYTTTRGTDGNKYMEIVLTLEEVKNIICKFISESQGDKPKEVVFVHKFSDGSGEIDVTNITQIDRVEIRF